VFISNHQRGCVWKGVVATIQKSINGGLSLHLLLFAVLCIRRVVRHVDPWENNDRMEILLFLLGNIKWIVWWLVVVVVVAIVTVFRSHFRKRNCHDDEYHVYDKPSVPMGGTIISSSSVVGWASI